MKERQGVAKGIDISKGFVGLPEAKTRRLGIEQLKKLTPKELGNSLTTKEPVQPNQSGGDEGYDKRRGSLIDRVLEQIVLDYFEPKKSSS
jgi:hypothetical protein